MNPDVLILIPAFNEENRISEVVKEVRDLGFEVLVVDDGSQDRTSVQAEGAGAVVLKAQANEGKGAALRLGFKWFLNQPHSTLLLMDSDGQHDPKEILKFIDALQHLEADFVVGNRLQNPQGMPLVRVITNRFMSWILSSMTGIKIADSQCGYRAIRREALKKMHLRTSHFEIESEMLIEAARLKLKTISIPIRCLYKTQQSRIHPLLDTIRFLKFLFYSPFLKEHS